MWDDDLSKLMENMGYRFTDPALLELALSHRSFANERPGREHNERLEYLGDAVLDLCVGHLLMTRLPDAREGQLTKLRAMLVSSDGLSHTANELRLGNYLLLGKGERQTGGQHKASLLADTLEAVVGAVFLDGGYEAAASLTDRLLGPNLDHAVAGDLDRDFKGQLQQLTQGRHQGTPAYELVETHGPEHEKTFVVSVLVDGQELARGEGGAKKEAERRAAADALKMLGGEMPGQK